MNEWVNALVWKLFLHQHYRNCCCQLKSLHFNRITVVKRGLPPCARTLCCVPPHRPPPSWCLRSPPVAFKQIKWKVVAITLFPQLLELITTVANNATGSSFALKISVWHRNKSRYFAKHVAHKITVKCILGVYIQRLTDQQSMLMF